MSQHVRRGGVLGQWKSALVPCASDKPRDHLSIDIVECRVSARSLLERPAVDGAVGGKVVHEALLNEPDELLGRGEAPPNQLPTRLTGQTPHPWVTPLVVCAPHEDEPCLAALGCTIELAMRGRNAVLILGAVLLAEEPKVDGALVNALDVRLAGSPVSGRQLLKEEDLKEPAQQGVGADVIGDSTTFLREPLLYAADEDEVAHVAIVAQLRLMSTLLCAYASAQVSEQEGVLECGAAGIGTPVPSTT